MLFMKESTLCFKEKQQHNISFHTFKLPESTQKHFISDSLNIIFDNIVNDY